LFLDRRQPLAQDCIPTMFECLAGLLFTVLLLGGLPVVAARASLVFVSQRDAEMYDHF
jgi:hypothetical protein